MSRTHAYRTVAALGVALALTSLASAQTWTGLGDANWTAPDNWSGFVAPLSSNNTTLSFGSTISPAMTNDFSGTFVVNSLGFGAGAPAYSLTGNPLAFQASTGGTAPAIGMSTSNSVLIGNNLTLTNNLTVNGTGAGVLTLNGNLTGPGSLTYSGAGTLILGGFGNAYAGGTVVNSGTVALGSGSAVPAGGGVTVNNAGTFNTEGLSNSAATAIGTLTLNSNATFRAASGSGDYFLNQLTLAGGTADVTGSSNFWLHFVGAGGITATQSSSFIGAGTSRIQNDTGNPLPISVAVGETLSIGMILSANGVNPTFNKTGGGQLLLLNTGNTANINVTGGSVSTFDISSNVGAGAYGTFGTGTVTLSNCSLLYNEASATTAKPFTLAGGAFIQAGIGVNLTMTGVIGESVANSNLQLGSPPFAGPGNSTTFTLTAANTYTGPTYVGSYTILAVPTVANGGVASPLGAASNAAYNLNLGSLSGSGATLDLVGTNPAYSTDRGITLGASGGTIAVQNAGTNLTLTGQITGPGALMKSGAGTLTLGGSSNNYTGGTFVNAGQLAINNGAALPAGSTVTVLAQAQFSVSGVSNSPSTAIGALTLNGGGLQVVAQNTVYYLGQLVTNTAGGSVTANDPVGTGLIFTNPAAVTINGNSTWSGNNGFIIGNSSPGIMTMSIAPNVTLTDALSLYATSPANAIRVTGGGTFYQTSHPLFSAFVQVSEARLRMDDLTSVAPGQFDVTLDNGTLTYGGPTAAWPAGFSTTAAGGAVEVLNAATTLTLTGTILGPGPVVKSGPGALILNNPANLYLGGIVVNAGSLNVASDNQLGTAAVTVNAAGTLLYTANVTTARTFNLNYGTLSVPTGVTLTLSGAAVNGGFLRGSGTFALTGGTTLAGVTTFNTTVLTQNGPANFLNFSNAGSLTVAGGSAAPASLNGFINQGSGSITVATGSAVNAADFQSYGTLTLTPAVMGGGQQTLMTNSGSSAMYFNGGSRTFIGTPATAVSGGQPTFLAGIDLEGKNLVIAGGLFVNNGFVSDFSTGAAGSVVVDYGALYKGAGFTGVSIVTQNGGRVQAGNSPGSASFGKFVFGPGGVSNYVFAIDDATGTAGPSPDALGHVSGWGLINVISPPANHAGLSGTGDFTWTADPTNKLSVALDTLVNPTTVGTDVAGLMADFDPTHAYSWPAVRWTGTYSGPTDSSNLDASTSFDTTGFVNPIAGTFGWVFDAADQTLSVTYTPSAVPEPGTLAMVGLAAIGLARRRRPAMAKKSLR